MNVLNNDCIPGYRGGNVVTKEDRNIEIAATALMLKQDILTLEKACKELHDSKEGSHLKVKSLSRKIEEVMKALNCLGTYANNILILTNKKTLQGIIHQGTKLLTTST